MFLSAALPKKKILENQDKDKEEQECHIQEVYL